MARLKSPLFSISAQKQLGKSLIYKMKQNRAFVTGYGKPGSKNRLVVSEAQTENRNLYGEILALWQALTPTEKTTWDELVKSQNLNMSGWNLFYKTKFAELWGVSDRSIYGLRRYGLLLYGKTA